MNEIGYYSIFIALLLAGYSSLTAIVGVKGRRGELIASSENAAMAVFAFITLASVAMIYALLTRDFQVEYVWHYSNRSLSWFYTLTAFYAGQKGSLLLWAWLLSIFSVIVVFQNRKKNRALMPYVLGILMSITFFFTVLMVFATNPFELLNFTPRDGQGLNPLLQNPGMIFHPPTLYLGYVGITVPFAFSMAALITGRLGDVWIKTTRRWTIFSWFFLTVGNMFGMEWAYVELGWGGYWAWDPVENASRKRLLYALDRCNRVPAFGDDPGEKGNVEGLEFGLDYFNLSFDHLRDFHHEKRNYFFRSFFWRIYLGLDFSYIFICSPCRLLAFTYLSATGSEK